MNTVTIKAEISCPYCGATEEMEKTMRTIARETDTFDCPACDGHVQTEWVYSAYVTARRAKKISGEQ